MLSMHCLFVESMKHTDGKLYCLSGECRPEYLNLNLDSRNLRRSKKPLPEPDEVVVLAGDGRRVHAEVEVEGRLR